MIANDRYDSFSLIIGDLNEFKNTLILDILRLRSSPMYSSIFSSIIEKLYNRGGFLSDVFLYFFLYKRIFLKDFFFIL